jgi:hypothetical protein
VARVGYFAHSTTITRRWTNRRVNVTTPEKVTRAALEGKKSGFGSLTKQQLDALAWAARWDASGAYIMAGMTYRLAWETHRLVKMAVALFATTSALLLLGMGVLIFQ